MFVVTCNFGNADSGDMGSMLVGISETLDGARKVMEDDFDAFIADKHWADIERRERFIGATDGDRWDHEGWSVWCIFDSDDIGHTAIEY